MHELPDSHRSSALIELDRSLPSGRALTDLDIRENYSHDENEAVPVLADAVVRVTSTEEVSATLRIPSEHGVPVTARAGGTGRTGGAIPTAGGPRRRQRSPTSSNSAVFAP